MGIFRVVVGLGFLTLVWGGLPASAASSSPAPQRVVGRKGPVELWVELKETRIKTGSRLRFKLGLKNVGQSTIKVHDVISRHIESLSESLEGERGIFLEAVDAGGKPLFAYPEPPGNHQCTTVLSAAESAARAAKEASLEYAVFGEDPYDHWRWTAMAPGKSLVTPPWEKPIWKGCKVQARISQDGYADLYQFIFNEPGNFKVRAVFDNAPDEFLLRRGKYRWAPENIRVATPWVEVLVK